MKTSFWAHAAFGLALSAAPASAQQFNRAIIFGDSLSDNGNIAALAGGFVPNYLPVGIRTTRFSNGPVFTEQLFGPASTFSAPISPNAGNVDYAFGGSRTSGPQTPGPTTQQQIGAFFARGGVIGPNDIVSLYAGANNLFQGIPVAAGNPATATTVLGGIAAAAAGDVGAQARQLAAAGARTIVVVNLPNFSGLPEFATGPAAQLAGFGSSAFNSALTANLAAAG
jgi:outer membrane lipase/esterase